MKRLVATAVALACAGSADAQTFKQVARIEIPGTPIENYGVMTIDQATGLGYLADKDNKAVVVFDTRTDKYVTRIGGFVGMTGNGNTSGPNGLAVVNSGPNIYSPPELWVSDGDSTVKVIDLQSGKIAATIHTGGTSRANAMAFDPKNQVVIVANSNDEVPFFSLISIDPKQKHRVVAKLPVPQSSENLERSAWHAPSGTFYTAIPVFSADKSKGLLAQTDPKSGTIVKLHELERCHPHSLSIVSDATIFLGCSASHGPDRKPGGDMAVFDIASGKIESLWRGLGRQWRLDRQSRARAVLSRHDQWRAGGGRHQDPAARAEGPDLERCAVARRQSRDQQGLCRHHRQGRPLRRLHRGVRAGVNLDCARS